jgi:hypothetical protein
VEQPVAAEGVGVPGADEAQHGGRVGAETASGEIAAAPQLGDLSQDRQLLYLLAGGQSVGHRTQQRTAGPRLSSRVVLVQVEQQGQEIEVLKVAEYVADDWGD